MKFYVEITLLPDLDVSLNFVLQKVYQQLHFKFVEMKNEGDLQPIGISFPKYAEDIHTLGDKIRLFSEDAAILNRFNVRAVLGQFGDVVHITNVRSVPIYKEMGCFYRIQPKISQSRHLRLIRRKALREGVDPLVVFSNTRYPKQEQKMDVPFVWMKSASSGEKFCLFIGCTKKPVDCFGLFGTYGLSRESTVPIF